MNRYLKNILCTLLLLLGFNTAFALLKFNDSIVEKLVAEGSAKFKQLQLENEEHIKNKEYDKLNFIINLGSNDHLINHEILTTEKFINNPTKEQSLNNRLQQLFVNSNNTKQCYLLLISYFDVEVKATPPDGLTVEDVFNTGKFYNENSTIKDCKDLHNIITTQIENSLNVDKTKFYYLISLGRYRMVFQKNEKPQSAYTWFSHSNTPANQTPPTYFTETYDYLKQYLISSKDKRYNLRETLVEDYVTAFEQAYKNAPLKAQILNTYTSEGITAILQNFTSTDYYTLSVAERLHCLSVYAGYSMGGSITIINNNEEGYALKLTRYINKNELVQFYTGLAGQSTVKNSALYHGDKDDKALLVKLISRINDGMVGGDNYTKLIAIILNHFKTSEDLLDKYMGVSEKELRTIVYYSTDLIPSRSWSMTGRINYDVDLNNDGSLLIDREVASANYPDVACLFNTDDCATITWEPIDPINDLKIFDLIYFTNCSELSMIEEAGAAKDDEMIAPAVILKYCDDKNFNSNSIQAVSLAFDAVTLIAGPGAIKQAINSRKLVMALYEASQLFSAGGNLVVNVSNDPDLLALKQEYDNIMLYWDMANIIGGTGKIITKINTSVKNSTAKRITKQTGQNFITLYNSAVAAGKTIPTKIKQLYLYLKKKGINVSGVVNGAGNWLNKLDNLGLTALKNEINSFDALTKAKFLDEFSGASDDALRAIDGNTSLVNYWKINGIFIKNRAYPNVGHKVWDDTKNAIILKADQTETKILNAIENALPPTNNQVALAGAYSPELGGNVVLKYNDKNFNVNLLEPELKQHLDYLSMIKNDFDKGGSLYQKLYTNVPLEKIQNAGLAGTHAEILATNEIIKQLKLAGKFNSIQDLSKIYVLVKGRPSFGNMCRCPHCFQIIDGVKMIGNQ